MSGDGRAGADDVPYRTDGGQGPGELTDLDGIGSARAEKLRDAGFETVDDLRAASRADLAEVLGDDLAGRVESQLGADLPDGDREPAESGPTAPSDDSGPSVPSAGERETDGEEADEGDAGEEEPADSGPSIPSETGDEEAVEQEAGGEEPADSGPSVPPADSGPSAPSDAGEGAGSGQAGDDIGWESERPGDESAAGSGGEAEATVESGRDAAVETQQTDNGGEATVTQESGSDGELIAAAVVSFFVPGVGNMINGQVERGLIIFVIWVVWLIVGWGFGVVIVGSIVGLLTLGIGFILIALVVGLIEFLIHVLAAVDAYRGSKVVDNVTVKVDQVRGN